MAETFALELSFGRYLVGTLTDVALSTIRRFILKQSDEQLLNGDFSSGANWTLDGTATISGGTLNIASVAALTEAAQTYSFVQDAVYQITYTISAFSAGTAGIQFGGGTPINGTLRSSNGTFTEFLTANGNTEFRVVSGAGGFTGSFDNISLKRLS